MSHSVSLSFIFFFLSNVASDEWISDFLPKKKILSEGSVQAAHWANFERPLRTEESDFRKLTMPRTHQEQLPISDTLGDR